MRIYSVVKLFLSFHRAARYPLDVVVLHTHKQGDDNTADDGCPRAKDGEIFVKTTLFRVYQLIKPERNGVFVALADYRIDEDKIAPRRDKRGQDGIDDNGLCKRQNDFNEHDGLACAF